jgi:hypothetical protein
MLTTSNASSKLGCGHCKKQIKTTWYKKMHHFSTCKLFDPIGRQITYKKANSCYLLLARQHKRVKQHNLTEVEISEGINEYLHVDSLTFSESTNAQAELSFEPLTISPYRAELLKLKILRFIGRKAIPLSIAESEEFRALFSGMSISPVPSKLETKNLLAQEAKNIIEQIILLVSSSIGYGLASDTWTCHNRTFINYMLLLYLPNNLVKEVLYGIEEVSGKSVNAELVYLKLDQVIEKVGPVKLISIHTDNASYCRKAAKFLTQKYPWVLYVGCMAHQFNLLMKDIEEIPTIRTTIEKAMKLNIGIINSVKLHSLFGKISRENAKNNNDPVRGLQAPTETRFYSTIESLERILINEGNFDDLYNLAAVRVEFPKKFLYYSRATRNENLFVDLLEMLPCLSIAKRLALTIESNSVNIPSFFKKLQTLREVWGVCRELNEVIMKREPKFNTTSVLTVLSLDLSISSACLGLEFDTVQKITENLLQIGQSRSFPDLYVKEVENFLQQRELNVANLTNMAISSENWWIRFGSKFYPYLSQIFNILYYIPSSSIAAERCWSIVNNIITDKRSSLSEGVLNNLAIISFNKELDVFEEANRIISTDIVLIPKDDVLDRIYGFYNAAQPE